MERIFRFFQNNFRLGLRIVKTGIAVTFCIAIANILHLEQPFIAVIAAVISMGKSIDLSLKAGKNKMIGVMIGCAVGALLASISPGNAGLCGIGVILSFYLCHFFHLNDAGILSSFSFAAVMFSASGDAPWRSALSCMGTALLGIAIAVIINLTVMPPNYAAEIKKTYSKLTKRTRDIVEDAAAHKTIDTTEIREIIAHLSQALDLYTSEVKILRWNDNEVFSISSNILVYQLILDELKTIEIMELMETKEPDEEILTVYHYHMDRIHELLSHAEESGHN